LPQAIRKDLRDSECQRSEGFDAVIHLAAQYDPIGNLNDSWTEDINFHASASWRSRKAAGQPTSSSYHTARPAPRLLRRITIDPKTDARSKVKARYNQTGSGFTVFIRNGTIYGPPGCALIQFLMICRVGNNDW
jgi:hypothetical protein